MQASLREIMVNGLCEEAMIIQSHVLLPMASIRMCSLIPQPRAVPFWRMSVARWGGGLACNGQGRPVM